MDSVVQTRCGKLYGRLSSGVAVFNGVPLAAPPFDAIHPRPRSLLNLPRGA